MLSAPRRQGEGSEGVEGRLVDVAESEVESEHGAQGERRAEFHRRDSCVEPTNATPLFALGDLAEDSEDTDQDMLGHDPPTTFRRWMSTLRRNKKAVAVTSSRISRFTLDDFDPRIASPAKAHTSQHHKNGSWSSSLRFVRGMKSATVTVASASIAASRRNSIWRRNQQSSIVSGSDPRPSIDTQRSVIDEAAKHRSRKRREKLEELVSTEQNYVADLRAFHNVCS